MRPVNLTSLMSAYHTLSEATFAAFKEMNNIQLRDVELQDIDALLKLLHSVHAQPENSCYSQLKIVEHFYIGYKISQIGKEFDLLRFSEDSIVNIELKSQDVGKEKIKKQLLKNKYYLEFLNKRLFLFTYISSQNIIYHLNEEQQLIEQPLQNLMHILDAQQSIKISNLDLLFNPLNYLISPFNEPDKFLAGQYFLTQQQEDIKRLIFRNSLRPQFVSIIGSPGTGKTLLIYDMAKSILERENVLLIHCGVLNEGHHQLKQQGWSILSLFDEMLLRTNFNFAAYPFIIIDEAQRMTQLAFNTITKQLSKLPVLCIFSYDPEQMLHEEEMLQNIPDQIKSLHHESYKLTNTIRTSKEIATFIKLLFDSNVRVKGMSFDNVELKFFEKDNQVRDYLQLLQQSDWKVIHYTSSLDNRDEPYYAYQAYQAQSAHEVIGQEYDQVVAVIDQYFDYDQDNKLIYRKPTYYHVERMLFQILTRARKKICLVFLNNEAVLEKCLTLMNHRAN